MPELTDYQTQRDRIRQRKKNDFSEALVYYMCRDDIQQCDLARALNVSTSAVSYWVCGRTLPRSATMRTIAAYFDVPVEELRKLPGELKRVR